MITNNYTFPNGKINQYSEYRRRIQSFMYNLKVNITFHY